ncbi:MAG: inositol monophosphatase [Gemmatimonadetes bacterium]|nr:inositol monophosphatase [Gemmatimonadota bacterium]NNF13809.1 inositol monophosphatase [Gemmatimonadota bacterium]
MNPLLRTAREAAEAAARIHRRDAGTILLAGATVKARADYVSKTDLDAQAAALAVISANHPDHVVLAEESDELVEDQLARWDGGPLWIVDPLDGTANFLHGHPHYCSSVAVAVDGRPVAGAVVSGSSGERWWASEGAGAFKSGKRIRVSGERPLSKSMVGTGFPFKLLDAMPTYLGQLDRVLRNASGVRRAGSAALDLCYLAQGSLDAFWEEILMPWDFAAGMVLVREAGGVLSRPDGGELELVPGAVRGANSAKLLEELRERLGDNESGRRSRSAS